MIQFESVGPIRSLKHLITDTYIVTFNKIGLLFCRFYLMRIRSLAYQGVVIKIADIVPLKKKLLPQLKWHRVTIYNSFDKTNRKPYPQTT